MHLTGAILVIDPASLEAMREAIQRDGEPLPISTSTDRPHDIIANAMSALYGFAGKSQRSRFAKPVAVVFAKADLPTVQRELGVQPISSLSDPKWRDIGTADSARIGQWLQQNDRELFQLLDTRFETVRFFAVSVYGDQNAEGRGFAPSGCPAPLCWILSHQALLRTPRLARVSRGAMEWAAMFATLGLFLGNIHCASNITF